MAMKRSAHTAQSPLTETTNYQSPKRSCTPRNKLQLASSHAAAATACSSEDFFTMEDHMESLVCMGFIDRELNRRILIQSKNDIGEAVTVLTGYNYFQEDISVPSESTTCTLGGPFAKEQQTSQQSNDTNDSQSNHSDESAAITSNAFTKDDYLDLETKIFGDHWSIPYRRDETLGQCLLSATKLALAGKADQDQHCLKFMEDLVPEIFQKLQCSHYVNNWSYEIQTGVLEMVELLIDLVAARLSYSPVPVRLLETLAVVFDCESVFQRKHRNEPYYRDLHEKQLGDRMFTVPPSSFPFSMHGRTDSYGWLCDIINRFVLKDGLVNLKRQFQQTNPLTGAEYNALLVPFVNCLDYVNMDKYRQLFAEQVDRALTYVTTLTEEDFKAKSAKSIFDLLLTLRKICVAGWPHRLDKVEQAYLHILRQMIASSNFNAKMNSLKEIAKIIENYTINTANPTKISIRREILSQWIIENSVLSKALEGNIDQNQYVEKVRVLMDFIASKILKDDIKTIWRMQHGRSSVAVDHLFTLIASAAAKFSSEQLNHLIELILQSWKTETILIQEKVVELLGTIGRECQKEASARVLEVLWNMAHDDRLSRSMLDHVLHCHLRIFTEGRSSSNSLKRDYCLKCVADLQRKQRWLVPAIRHLYDLLNHDSTNTFKRTDQDLISLLVNKHELMSALIQSLATCQAGVWEQTKGHVTVDTLVDGRFTHEESVKTHLDLLLFLLKKGNILLTLERAEELWDTLIIKKYASSFDRELGLNWFITCIDDLNQKSQPVLFRDRVSKLDPINLTSKGYACFKLYFEKSNLQRRSPIRSSSSPSTPRNVHILEYDGMDELWNIILCVADDTLADNATRFLFDMHRSKSSMSARRLTTHLLHEYFLKAVYGRLSGLLRAAVPPLSTSTEESEQFYRSLKTVGEELTNDYYPSSSDRIDHQLWLQKIERLLMMTEEYIRLMEHEHSPTAHICSFHGSEYQIKLIYGEVGKSNAPYDIAIVHFNDTLEMLRMRLAQFYKVYSTDVQISIQNVRPLPESVDRIETDDRSTALSSSTNNSTLLGISFNSKYLYEVQITRGTSIFIKVFGTSSNPSKRSIDTEPSRIHVASASRSSPTRAGMNSSTNTGLTPSDMMAENSKMYDVLYKLSFLKNENIHKRIRSLLYSMPSDVRIRDQLDQISMRTTKSSSHEGSASAGTSPQHPEHTIEQIFDLKTSSFVQLLYKLEILSSKILPLSINSGVRYSSKVFREDFIQRSGVDFLFRLLRSFNQFILDEYQYSLCQEIILLNLQLLQLFVCGRNPSSQTTPSKNSSAMAASASSPQSFNETSVDAVGWNLSAIVDGLSFDDFVAIVQQLVFLSWAAAAGDLRLHGQTLKIDEEVKADQQTLLQRIDHNLDHRMNTAKSLSRQPFTDGRERKTVQFGICVKAVSVSPLDSEIAEKTMQMITFCFEKRAEFLATFLVQPVFADYLLEMLIGTTSREIRQCTLSNIIRLCTIAFNHYDICSMIHQILIKARLPLWSSSAAGIRGSNQKLLLQSNEYFDLRCSLTENLTNEQQQTRNINAKELLAHEISWLSAYAGSSVSSDPDTIDNTLYLGHLKYIATLLTCESVEKQQFGTDFIPLLLDQFLFPASKKISCSLRTSTKGTNNFNESTDQSAPEPKCATRPSRLAAYDVLVELVSHCPENLKIIVDNLINLHHRSLPGKQKEWEFMPQVNPRASCGLVGLSNAGATCYMNSILQQLFMLPQIAQSILSIQDDHDEVSRAPATKNSNSNLFHQLQQVFGHLMESKMQYYAPRSLWKVFRLWGQEINVCEQQDAFDFFTSLIDQIDEYLRSIKHEEVFRKQFEGIFSNQMICTNGCQHRYEGEEKFMALNVAVKVDSLSESLNQFVKGELLDGNNAYFCEKCQEKRTTIKRLCIKKLPPMLCIQIKRFGFDWENNRALKFDDHFPFPLVLNMDPYTVDGVNKRENSMEHDHLVASATGESRSFSRSFSSSNYSASTTSTINYELVGIVIHSGQANAGHYYSFIKDTRAERSSNRNQWYRFNDVCVEEIELTEQLLEEECFGGKYRFQKEGTSNGSEERTRFWSAYMLIYQCIEPAKLLPPPPAPLTPISHRAQARAARRPRLNHRDSLSQLADLVDQGEQNNLFPIKQSQISPRVRACVQEENLEFLKYRDTYCDDYFQFIYHLCSSYHGEASSSPSYELCTNLALHFLFYTYLRTHRSLRKNTTQQWSDLLSRLFSANSLSCSMFYQFLIEENDHILKSYLLDCPYDDIRQTCEQICELAFRATNAHAADKTSHPWRKKFIEQCLSLLDQAVVEQAKHSQAYFQLIYTYASMNDQSIDHLFRLNVFTRLMNFLLGESLDSRRWTAGQAKEFGIIHEILSSLVLSYFVNNAKLERNSSERIKQMKTFYHGDESERYLREVCYAFQEISFVQLPRTLALIETLTNNDLVFSEKLIRIVLRSIGQPNTYDLKSLFKLLSHILLIDDSLQSKRLRLAFEGASESNSGEYRPAFNGLYLFIRTSIESEQRQAYQALKYLINLSKKAPSCRDYLSATATQWESAIAWLKQQMQTSSQWSSTLNLSNEDNGTRSFQRTRSAQYTLEQAQSLLQQTASPAGDPISQETSSNEAMEINDGHSASIPTTVDMY